MLFRRLLNYLTDPITSDPDVGDVPIFDGSRFVAGPGGAPSWLLHTATIPDNSVGSNGDYALGQDGVIYKKQAGTWGAYGGGGGLSTPEHDNYVSGTQAIPIDTDTQVLLTFNDIDETGNFVLVDGMARCQVPGVYEVHMTARIEIPSDYSAGAIRGLINLDSPAPFATSNVGYNFDGTANYLQLVPLSLPPVSFAANDDLIPGAYVHWSPGSGTCGVRILALVITKLG